METSFYHDDSLNQDKMKKPLKRPMTLDFIADGMSKKQKVNVLSSPDLNMLKLASPELERMLIAPNGMVTTTPTPTQFICPKYVTEEQEAYARGFVEALKELHEKEGVNGVDIEPQNVSFTSSTPTDSTCSITSAMGVMSSVAAPQYTTLTTASSLPVTVMPTTTGQYPSTCMSEGTMPVTVVSQTGPTMSPMTSMNNHGRIMQLKHEEEPQTVPCLGNTPPVSPINMEHQERIKLERKRERNRVAARKCRTRKLERISRLEDRVDELKGQNSDLSKTATTLRDQVSRLKQQIMEHVNGGCQLMVSQNLL